MIVGQDWGGPQGVGAALQRVERLDALVLMNTWLFTDYVGKFHQSPLPWTTWHAPLIGQLLMKRFKLLSHHGVSAITRRTMTEDEKRAYHHVFDEPDSDHVVLTWPRTIPLREGDRGWSDMQMIQRRLPELAACADPAAVGPRRHDLHDPVCEPAQGAVAARRRSHPIRSGRAFPARRSRP